MGSALEIGLVSARFNFSIPDLLLRSLLCLKAFAPPTTEGHEPA